MVLGGGTFVGRNRIRSKHENDRIAGVRLKPPPNDVRQYFEGRSNSQAVGQVPSERFPSNAIYRDLRTGRTTHTEEERIEARRQRIVVREERELRERAHLRRLRAIGDMGDVPRNERTRAPTPEAIPLPDRDYTSEGGNR